MDILNYAKSINEKIVSNRRALHQCPETGFKLPNTLKLVKNKLVEIGCTPVETGKAGITVKIGNDSGRCILLRCDMDALPMKEESGLPFASVNDNAHTCGHDIHTAMLLGAADILKKYEDKLNGCVKLCFQPAEEQLAGAVDMIKAGVLENPKVDAAFALHTYIGRDDSTSGTVHYNSGGITFSGDAIKIEIKGKDAHGSTPYLGVDAINIAAAIVQALSNIVNKEISCTDDAVVLVGRISGGTAVNTVAGSASMEVSVRAINPETRDLLKRRVKEIAEGVAKLNGGEAVVEYWYGMPSLINDENLTSQMKGYCEKVVGASNIKKMDRLSGSEDFCMFSEKVPSTLFMLGLGSTSEGYTNGLHHPAMIVNEDYLYVGAAVYANAAIEWLNNKNK